MRQVICLALTAALCLFMFCGCGASSKSSDNKAQKIQEEFSSIENFDIGVNITADYGERIFEYKMKYSGNSDCGSIEVLQPESISGLVIEVLSSAGTTKLKYDGAELDTGELADTGLTPVDALPAMLSQWKRGYISDAAAEKLDGTDCILITYRISDTVLLKTWFDNATHLPIKSEISSDGYTVIYCDFENIITEQS